MSTEYQRLKLLEAEQDVVMHALRWHSAIIEAPSPKSNPRWWTTKRATEALRASVERLKKMQERVLGVRTLGVKKATPKRARAQ